MVTIIHGSSHFKPMGQTAVTGPIGFTGPTGPTGPTGGSPLGQTGWSGGNITNMYLIGDKLHTIFAIHDTDGVHRGQTAGYTTTTRIKGQTGDTYNLIDGGNTFGGIGTGGATFAKGRNSSNELNSLVIKSIEVTGDNGGSAISLTQREDLDTINIHFDRGNFGYLDVGSGTQGQLVKTDNTNDLWLSGQVGTTYDIGTSHGLENGAYAINTRVQDYKEKIKYLTVGAAGSGSDLENLNEGPNQNPIYAPPTDTPIDPNRAKVLVLDMRQFENVGATESTGGVQLRFRDAHFGYTGNESDSNKNLGKAFTLITHGATVGYESSRFDGNNIIWPLDLEPCWSGETDIINFFWLPCEPRDINGDGQEDSCLGGAGWHGNIVQWKSQGTDIISGTENDPFFCHSETSNYTNDFKNYNSGMTGTTGACCVGDGICVHTMSNLCHGHYFGAGTTCGAGGTGSVCYELGACCVSNTQINKTDCYDDISSNECVGLGNILNYVSSFGGTGSECVGMNCHRGRNKRGACCDGLGRCFSLTEEECRKRKYYFAGVGISCHGKDGSNVCGGGTGACILSGTVCEDGWSGGACIDGGYLYAGNNSKCGDVKDIRKSSSTSGCIPEVSGLNLKPGDLYAGGMVVGLYRPHGSSIRGAKSFGGNKETSWQELMRGSTGSTGNLGYPLDKYKSKYDYHGYGFDSAGCQDYNKMSTLDTIARPDAYYIIVSMHHLGITGDREIINPDGVSGVTSDFFWGNRGSAWGPLYDQRTGKYDEITDEYNKRVFGTSEGYWYNQEHGDMSLGVLGENTFSSCKKARRLGNGAIQKLETKSIHSAHGLWHRNWGMYNNIRVISADNALHRNYNDNDGTYSGSDFGPGLTGSYVSSFRAARLFSDNLISATGATGPINNKVSSWYIPSHDEMAYIASNCIGDYSGFNLNAKLLEEDGVPIEGWHWTSTGAFNEVKGMTLGIGEGIINPVGATEPSGITADPGTLAWAMKFDVNGYWANFKVGKKNRTHNRYRVRPIRLIRCDGKFADGEDENYKLWKLPNVLRDEDKGINQRH
jgi:hypothetical protein